MTRPYLSPYLMPAALVTSILVCLALAVGCRRADGPLPATRAPLPSTPVPAGSPRMVKLVTDQASFVLYLPEGWKAQEESSQGFRTLIVTDPETGCGGRLSQGANISNSDVTAQAAAFLSRLTRKPNDLELRQTMLSRDKTRIMFDGKYLSGGKKKEFRGWASVKGGEFVCMMIEAPDGKLEQMKELLLTTMSNVRTVKGAFVVNRSEQPVLPLAQRQLADGSARFKLPADWKYQALGPAAFIAGDPRSECAFMVASVPILTPRLGVIPRGVAVMPYSAPHVAFQQLTKSQGVATDMKFIEVTSQDEIARQINTVYTAGPVQVEGCLYTFKDKQRRGCKGFTFGISYGTHSGISWSLWHMTATAPADRFDSLIPTYSAMMQSYAIDDKFAAEYVAKGTARLREMQRQTANLVTRNAQEIHQTMQAAYDERQKSQDYIDYQRTNYIRGEQDWISEVEGGTVYHTDTWGTKNTDTGETWEGRRYDYVHFKGDNPKYREEMTPIDNRELWQKYVQQKGN